MSDLVYIGVNPVAFLDDDLETLHLIAIPVVEFQNRGYKIS